MSRLPGAISGRDRKPSPDDLKRAQCALFPFRDQRLGDAAMVRAGDRAGAAYAESFDAMPLFAVGPVPGAA